VLLLAFEFIVDDADVVEAASEQQIHELYSISGLHIQQFVGFDHHEDLCENELSLQAFQMGLFDPLKHLIFVVFDLVLLLAHFSLCHSDNLLGLIGPFFQRFL
jgi:hypothetical protein